MSEIMDRHPASPGDESIAEHVLRDWRQMSPEEWLARHFHESPFWPFSGKIYADPEFDAWICQVNEIIWPPQPLVNGARTIDHDRIEQLRKHYLTAHELAKVKRQMAEPF